MAVIIKISNGNGRSIKRRQAGNAHLDERTIAKVAPHLNPARAIVILPGDDKIQIAVIIEVTACHRAFIDPNKTGNGKLSEGAVAVVVPDAAEQLRYDEGGKSVPADHENVEATVVIKIAEGDAAIINTRQARPGHLSESAIAI